MSLILDRPVTAARTVSPARTSSTAAPLSRTAAATAAAATAPAPAEPAAPRTRSLPEGTEARGFALYVGIDEVTAAQTGTELGGDTAEAILALVANDDGRLGGGVDSRGSGRRGSERLGGCRHIAGPCRARGDETAEERKARQMPTRRASSGLRSFQITPSSQ